MSDELIRVAKEWEQQKENQKNHNFAADHQKRQSSVSGDVKNTRPGNDDTYNRGSYHFKDLNSSEQKHDFENSSKVLSSQHSNMQNRNNNTANNSSANDWYYKKNSSKMSSTDRNGLKPGQLRVTNYVAHSQTENDEEIYNKRYKERQVQNDAAKEASISAGSTARSVHNANQSSISREELDQVVKTYQAKRNHSRFRPLAFIIAFVALAGLAVGGYWLLSTHILSVQTNSQYVSRSSVAKEVSLTIASKEQCLEANVNSYFSEEDQDLWYVKYMDYLFENGILSGELTEATKKSASGYLTYEELYYLCGQLDVNAAILPGNASEELLSESVTKETWNLIYLQIKDQLDPEGTVKEEDVCLYATPSEYAQAASWQAYTSNGIFTFEGLALESMVDKEIRILVKDNEILKVESVLSDQVCYENVWITQSGEGSLTIFMDGLTRTFKDSNINEDYSGLIGDVTLTNGSVTSLSLKQEMIEGKVLSIKDEGIEIEGYGVLSVSENARVYKAYGELEAQNLSDIMVGSNVQQFVVAGGQVCAALTVRAYDAQNIRVLIKTSDYSSLFHQEVSLTCSTSYTIYWGEESRQLAAEDVLTISPGSEYVSQCRVRIEPDEGGQLKLLSVLRNGENHEYPGTMEIAQEESGLLIINDTLLEEYLTLVVPSEMPVSYGVEALKVQAVCARSYAYRQILANSYSNYGAHVDDSSNYQVYNNSATDETVAQAVDDTYGQVITYGEEVITAYYFSTSCGHTTDTGIWGNESSLVYLSGRYLAESQLTSNTGINIDLTNNDSFAAFIKNLDFDSFDMDFPWYRWNISVSLEQLSNTINNKLASLMQSSPSSILVQNSDGEFVEGVISSIGTVQSVEVTQRSTGGVVSEMIISGTSATIKVIRQSAVRSLLGNTQYIINRKDGSTATDKDILPSAYIYFEAVYNGDTLTGYMIYGGGNGHGVGMSQNAVEKMTKLGMTYDEIITYFYQDTTLKQLY